MFDQFPGCRKSGERKLSATISKSNAIWTVNRLASRKNFFIRKFERFRPPDFLRCSDEVLARPSGDWTGGYRLSIPKDNDAVADLEDFLQVMRDVDDSEPLHFEL